MKKTTQCILFLLIALLLSCGGDSNPLASNNGGISGTGDGGKKTSLAGSAYKGPYIQDSTVNVVKIEGDTSSEVADTQVQENLGNFYLEVEPGLLSVTAIGRFYDETDATYSEDPVSLKALVEVGLEQQATLFVNVLTLLSHDYTLRLIDEGNSYQQASVEAERRVKDFLTAVTGEIPTSQPFANMNISNTPGTVAEDNAYSLYISSLFTEAVNERSIEEPQYTMSRLLNTLRTELINGDPIDDETLTSLQEAHGRLDAASIKQNLEAVLVGQTIAPVGDIIEAVSPGLVPPFNLTSFTDTDVGAQRFCFDMEADCSSPEYQTQIMMPDGYSYELQLDDDADFSSPLISELWRRNYFDIETASLEPGTWYFRVRRNHDSGQFSTWAETEFLVP